MSTSRDTFSRSTPLLTTDDLRDCVCWSWPDRGSLDNWRMVICSLFDLQRKRRREEVSRLKQVISKYDQNRTDSQYRHHSSQVPPRVSFARNELLSLIKVVLSVLRSWLETTNQSIFQTKQEIELSEEVTLRFFIKRNWLWIFWRWYGVVEWFTSSLFNSSPTWEDMDRLSKNLGRHRNVKS